jgi:hypothetical protein
MQSQGVKIDLNGFSKDIAVVSGRPSGKYPDYVSPAVWEEYGWVILQSGPAVETASITFTATKSGIVSIQNNSMSGITLDDFSLFPDP